MPGPKELDSLTLRDRFALIVAAHIDGPETYIGDEHTEKSFRAFAAKCYRLADAMLDERKKSKRR